MNKIDELFDLILDKIDFIEITINRSFLKKFKKEHNGINFYYTSNIKDLVYIIRKTLICYTKKGAKNYINDVILNSPLGFVISPLKYQNINIVFVSEHLKTNNPRLFDEVLYHEIGHIVCGHLKNQTDSDDINFQYEREADNYSKSVLGLSKLIINEPDNSDYIAELSISILKQLINDYNKCFKTKGASMMYLPSDIAELDIKTISVDIRSQLEARA